MDILQAASLPSTADPLITVAIPTFNRVEWLNDCIRSVLAQTYQHFEVVVSDNASTDGTPELLAAISDRRLRVIRQKSNIGLLPNWNACLMAATGGYIVFVSDDDRIAPDFLDRCIALIGNDRQMNVVLGLCDTFFAVKGTYSISSRGTFCPAHANTRLGTGIWDGADILLEFLRRRISAQMCTILMRTEALRAGGGFPTDLPYAADLAAWAPLLLTGRSAFINESCGTSTRHEETQTSKLTLDTQLKDHKAAVNLIATAADHSSHDFVMRKKIKSKARRNIANVTIDRLIDCCVEGKSIVDILPLVREYYRDIIPGNVHMLVILVWFMFFPVPVATALRDLMLGFKAALGAVPGLKEVYHKLVRD